MPAIPAIIVAASVLGAAGMSASSSHQARKSAKTASAQADKDKREQLRKAEAAETAAKAEAEKKILLRRQGQTKKVYTQGLGSYSPVVAGNQQTDKTKTLG